MSKKITKLVKLQIQAGKATPAPPVGTALGPTGINIQAFCQEFNERTRENAGFKIPAVISIYEDRTFSFITKQPPMTDLVKKAAGITSGSKMSHKDKVAHLTLDQVRAIAEQKIVDMNCDSMESAMSMVAGSARSMGITTDVKKK